MKKIILLFILVSTATSAQIISIPDANFKTALLNAAPSNTIANNGNDYIKIDSNNDGEIQQSEADEVEWLDVTNCNILSLAGIHSFSNLMYLICRENNLTNLDVHGMSQLRTLDCDHNMISVLDVSGCANLYTLVINYNTPLLTLDASNLYALQNLTLNDNMVSIDVSNCTSLTSFGYAFPSLETLNVSGCTAMTNFYLGFTYLTSLDLSNLTSLIGVTCIGGHLQNLNLDGCVNLQHLDCSDNQLTNLDVSAFPNLIQLDCSENGIHDLDVSALTHLTNLDCSYNNLYSLNVKNGINEALVFNQNPNLQYICVDDFQLTPGFLYLAGPTVNVNTYCSFVPGGNYNSISGRVTFDEENNGCDPEDIFLYHFGIRVAQGANQNTIYSNMNGNYAFYPSAGNITLTPFTENPSWFAITPSSITAPFPANNTTSVSQNFCVSPVGTHNDLEVSFFPVTTARPGFDAKYQIVYKNKGNQTLSGVVGLDYNDPVLDFVSATVVPGTQAIGNLNWTFANLLPFESRSIEVTLNVNSPQEIPSVNIGHMLAFSATVNSVASDETPQDNIFVFNQIVVGALDPNDKVCHEGNQLAPERIGGDLHYTINFENTGTAAAENVVIKDIIDAVKFDVSTLQVLDASNPVVTKITGNKVEFIFENINLAAAAHGNVTFKIKTRNTIAVGDYVTNKADIFFDYNFPVETNTATTMFSVLAAQKFTWDHSLYIYPNPAGDFVKVKCNESIKSIELYDVQGRIVYTSIVEGKETTVDLSQYYQGIYYLHVRTDRGIRSEKLLKK